MVATPQAILFVEPDQVGPNPIQEELWPDRITNTEELEKQFEAYASEHGGDGYNRAYPITVRKASRDEMKEKHVQYIAIDGHRRRAVASKRGIESIPIVIDPEAASNTDIFALKRVVLGDEGYTPVEKARIVEKMIASGVSYDNLKREFDPEILMRMLAFRAAPKDLHRIVERDHSKFTKLAIIAKTVLSKATGSLEYQPPEGLTRRDTDAAIRYVMSREDLNAEKARRMAVAVREQLKNGKLAVGQEGRLIPTERTAGTGITVHDRGHPQELWSELSRAIDKIRLERGGRLSSKATFESAISGLMETHSISVVQLTKALGVTRPFVAQLLNRTSHPSPEILAKLRLELLVRGIDEATVDQIWLLGERDRATIPRRRAEIAQKYHFRSGSILRGFLTTARVTQQDLSRGTGISEGQVSSILSDKSQPAARQTDLIARFLREHAINESEIDVWRTAVGRDRVVSFMIGNKGFSRQFLDRAMTALDAEFQF